MNPAREKAIKAIEQATKEGRLSFRGTSYKYKPSAEYFKTFKPKVNHEEIGIQVKKAGRVLNDLQLAMGDHVHKVVRIYEGLPEMKFR